MEGLSRKKKYAFVWMRMPDQLNLCLQLGWLFVTASLSVKSFVGFSDRQIQIAVEWIYSECMKAWTSDPGWCQSTTLVKETHTWLRDPVIFTWFRLLWVFTLDFSYVSHNTLPCSPFMKHEFKKRVSMLVLSEWPLWLYDRNAVSTSLFKCRDI